MMENKFDYNLIERYVRGSLDGKELKDFEDQLAKNPALFKEVEFYKELGNVIRIKGKLNNVFTNKEQAGFFDTLEKKKPRLTKVSFRRIANIAAISIGIVFTTLIGISQLYYSNNSLATVNAEMFNFDFSNYRIENSTQDIFEEGFNYLNNEQYTDAIAFFKNFNKNNEAYYEAQLYLAFAQINTGNYDESIQSSKNIIQAQERISISTFQKAEWLLIKGLIGKNDANVEKEIDNLLKKLANDKNHFFQERALNLEQKLNSILRTMVYL